MAQVWQSARTTRRSGPHGPRSPCDGTRGGPRGAVNGEESLARTAQFRLNFARPGSKNPHACAETLAGTSTPNCGVTMLIEESMPPGPQASLPLLAAADLQDSLMVATNDLDRLQRLLTDATETLMGHFYGASGHITHLSRLAAQHPELPESDLHQTMAHLAGAVTALQFQDMASQLIAHTHRRLRNCADRLARDVMGDDEDGATVIEEAPLRPNPVTQDEMDAGSIELF
jgi:hypothetical protein